LGLRRTAQNSRRDAGGTKNSPGNFEEFKFKKLGEAIC
jgi:hypothetical protein